MAQSYPCLKRKSTEFSQFVVPVRFDEKQCKNGRKDHLSAVFPKNAVHYLLGSSGGGNVPGSGTGTGTLDAGAAGSI
jgi:hypothetical protein